ncbi:hypothetical protein N9265_00255 [bacterium]|nr:hypothetical protein [bacterium]
MENKSYKEILEDIEKWESVRSKNQGRSKRQVENNYKMVYWTAIAASAIIVISFILNLLGWL